LRQWPWWRGSTWRHTNSRPALAMTSRWRYTTTVVTSCMCGHSGNPSRAKSSL
jgi:hypothetical protein